MDSRLRKPKHIFECYVELVRQNEEGGPESSVTYLYPKDYKWEEDTKKQLPKFTFSTSQCSDTEEHFAFVLTDLEGKYRFGFCRSPPKGETCMCFLSDLPWYKVFYKALDKIADLRHDFQSEIVEPFLCGLRCHSLPTPGVDAVLSIIPADVDAGQVYTFPLPNPKRLPEIPADHNLTSFYTSLHPTVILHLFANMIFERRIIITSKSLSLLSSAVHGAVILLYPLHWQHIFIPITPFHLIDYCTAPMPFLMGVHSSMMNRVCQMPLDDVVILDMDESTLESPHCDDLDSLPADVIATLKHVLKKQSSAYGYTVAKAFMLAQVSMLGGYRSALKLRPGDKEVVFDEDSFLQSRPNMEEFLGELLHFQHFRQFINCRIERLKNKKHERDLFDNEVLLYEEELKGTTHEHLKAAFERLQEGGKRLWDKTKEGSEKGWKNTKIFVKETKRRMRQDKDKIVHKDYPGQTIANTALLLESDHHKYRYNSLPSSGRQAPSDGQPKARKPPPAVIPYQRHVEGKRRLIESLRQSGISIDTSDSTHSAPEIPIGTLLSFTPPDTPRTVQSADQSSLDRYERASLDSKTSTEASVASGEMAADEVVTGNLIDISAAARTNSTQAKREENAERRADSPISTASSSDSSIPDDWERFDDDRPPLPPPRSALRHHFSQPRSQADSPVPDATESDNSTSSLNPFEMELARITSPIDDFGTSVAQSLINSSRRFSDPFAANTLATMSSDLMKTLGEVSEESKLPEPLIPTSSSRNSTSNILTALPRSSPQINTALTHGRLGVSPPFLSSSSPNLPTITGPGLVNGMSVNVLVSKSTSVGNSPTQQLKSHSPKLQHQPLLQPHPAAPPPRPPAPVENFTANPTLLGFREAPSNQSPSPPKRPPPPKPQPYTGSAVSVYQEQQMRDSNNPFAPPKYDPFESLFGDGGLEAYAGGSLLSEPVAQTGSSLPTRTRNRDTTRV